MFTLLRVTSSRYGLIELFTSASHLSMPMLTKLMPLIVLELPIGMVWKETSSMRQLRNWRANHARFAAVRFVSTFFTRMSISVPRFGMLPSVSIWLASAFRKLCWTPMRWMSPPA